MWSLRTWPTVCPRVGKGVSSLEREAADCVCSTLSAFVLARLARSFLLNRGSQGESAVFDGLLLSKINASGYSLIVDRSGR